MSDLVIETFKEDGLLAKHIPNYLVREQQIDLAKKIQECIKEEKGLLAEGPTGTGKSIAALVPAFEHIKKTDEPVIVVTSSIVLQEQYMNKDIPLLEEIYDFKVNPVLLKGRNNYLCVKKHKDVREGKMNASTNEQVEQHQKIMEWAATTKTGDKSELEFVPSFQLWSQYACIENTECSGKQCPLYSLCHYYRERNRVESTRLIVCNYHYFFTALDNESMLPPKARVVILDEGHEVSSIARDFQERKYSMNSLRNQFDHFAKAMEQALLTDVAYSVSDLFEDMNLNHVNGTLTELFVGISHEYKKRGSGSREFWTIEIPERTRLQKYATEHIKAMTMAVTAAENYLEKYGFSPESIMSTADYYGEEVAEWFMDVFRLSEFLADKVYLLEYIFAYEEEQDEGDDIFWVQPFQESVSIHAKPTTGARLTERLFRKREEGFISIMMSATLSAAGSFDYIKNDLGIEANGQYPVEEMIVSSPFDLNENLLWYLPPDTPAGNFPSHLDFVLSEMKKVINKLNGRALCLFTSRKNLQTAEHYFKSVLPKEINLISQEQMPRQMIIEYMKENDNTVVLGTKSMFTGIDVQGHHLSAVLIDKIPFPMIGDPINDYLMSQPNGFHKYSLPEAIISIKQAFGRLNRTIDDKGIVAIFDGRLSTARYKNKIFNSFDFKINATTDWKVVEHYIAGLEVEKDLSLF
jgi:ATP-dependent DNA helicase DinG